VLARDAKGKSWVARGGEVGCLVHGQFVRLRLGEGDSEGFAQTLGAGSAGLNALRARKLGAVNAPDHWQGRAVLSIAGARDGALWVGTEGAGLYRFQGGNWTRFGEAEGLVHPFVWTVLEDAQDRVWVGTWGGGLFVRRGERFERAPGLEKVTTPMTALYQGSQGELWVGTAAGLLRYDAGQATWFGHTEGLAVPDVRTVTEDSEGTIWFGMSGGGLGCLKNGAVRQFRKRDGLASDFVLCLRAEPDRALWIGTLGGGLSRLKQGRFTTSGDLVVQLMTPDGTMGVTNGKSDHLLRLGYPIANLQTNWQKVAFLLNKGTAGDGTSKTNFPTYFDKINELSLEWQINSANQEAQWGYDTDNMMIIDNFKVERLYVGLPLLSLNVSNNTAVVTWGDWSGTGYAQLQGAGNVKGDYQDITNATNSPSLVPLTSTPMFFRTRWVAP